MDVSFDFETKQRVIKLSATEEGLLNAAMNTAAWYTHDDDVKELCDKLRSELKNDRN